MAQTVYPCPNLLGQTRCCTSFVESVSYLHVNWCISNSFNIVPLQKYGPLYDQQNYHPMNQTPNLARLLERIGKDRLIDLLTTNDLTVESRHGFLKRRSLTSCCFAYFDLVTLIVDKRPLQLITLFDTTKALDSLPHE